MAVEAVKSTSVTNLDSSPVVYNTEGEGAAYFKNEIDDFVTIPASASTGSTFRIVRVPTTVKVKDVILESEAQGAGAFDVGVYYSSSVNDSPAAAALAGAAVDQDLFATAVSAASLVTPTNVTNESTTYNLSKRALPLWQAAGLTSDPGGYFDIVATVATTAVTTGTGRLGLRVGFAK